jgi:hypothetical protein
MDRRNIRSIIDYNILLALRWEKIIFDKDVFLKYNEET